MILEIWKEIKNSNGDYKVSNTGKVISCKTGKPHILKPRWSRDGYLRYSLRIQGKTYEWRAHRLVAEYFIPNPENKDTVNHIDGDKTNNNVENLEWATRNEQMKHAYRLGLKKPMRGTLQKTSRLSESAVRDIRANYKAHSKTNGARAFARKYGVSQLIVERCVSFRTYRNVL